MKGCIVTSRGYYQWNPHLDCSVDVFEVNDLSELARKESDAEKRSRIYEQIVNLYDGRLLPQSASEPWVESVSVRLHGQYRTAILNLLELCKNGARAPASLRCVPARWSWTPTRSAFIWKRSSRWRRWAATRRRRIWHAAAAPWAACIMPLSRAAQALPTARCARQTAIWRARVSKLISALPDTEDTGACICDFETFKEIYRVQRGVQVRYGLQVFLAILTVAPQPEHRCCRGPLMVEQLGNLIRTNLRQCDVAARYTDMQYVVMLSGSTAEKRHRPAGAHQGRVLPHPRPWPLPVEL